MMKRFLHFIRGRPETGPSEGYVLKKRDLGKVHKAAVAGDVAKLKQLAKTNFLNEYDSENRTALHLACAFGQAEVVQFLLENRVFINRGDGQNRTALMKAAQCNQDHCASILLEHKADPNLVDADGNTALHLAARVSAVPVVQYLLKHKGNLNIQNKEGNTPLMLAVERRHAEMADILLQNGANVNVTNEKQWSALMIALTSGYTELVHLLLQYNPDVHLQDKKGWSASRYAQINKSLPCSRLIINHGVGKISLQSPPVLASSNAQALFAPRGRDPDKYVLESETENIHERKMAKTPKLFERVEDKRIHSKKAKAKVPEEVEFYDLEDEVGGETLVALPIIQNGFTDSTTQGRKVDENSKPSIAAVPSLILDIDLDCVDAESTLQREKEHQREEEEQPPEAQHIQSLSQECCENSLDEYHVQEARPSEVSSKVLIEKMDEDEDSAWDSESDSEKEQNEVNIPSTFPTKQACICEEINGICTTDDPDWDTARTSSEASKTMADCVPKKEIAGQPLVVLELETSNSDAQGCACSGNEEQKEEEVKSSALASCADQLQCVEDEDASESSCQQETIPAHSQKLSKAEACAYSLEQIEATLSLDTVGCKSKDLERSSHTMADYYSMQEGLAQVQKENALLRQQLKEAQLRAEGAERVQQVEERNKELVLEKAKLTEHSSRLEQEKAVLESSVRQLQQKLAYSLMKLAMCEESLQDRTRCFSELQEEKVNTQKEMDNLRGKLKHSEEQYLHAERCITTLKATLGEKDQDLLSSGKRLEEVLAAASNQEDTIKQLEATVQRLETDNARLEATAKQQTDQYERLQTEAKEATAMQHQLQDLVKTLQSSSRSQADRLSLETQAASHTNAVNEKRTRAELEQHNKELEADLSKAHSTEKDIMLQKDFSHSEIKHYQQLYNDEHRLGKSFTTKLKKVSERLAETNTKPLSMKQHYTSLLSSKTKCYDLSLRAPHKSRQGLGAFMLSPVTQPLTNSLEDHLLKVQRQIIRNISNELDNGMAELQAFSSHTYTGM